MALEDLELLDYFDWDQPLFGGGKQISQKWFSKNLIFRRRRKSAMVSFG